MSHTRHRKPKKPAALERRLMDPLKRAALRLRDRRRFPLPREAFRDTLPPLAAMIAAWMA